MRIPTPTPVKVWLQKDRHRIRDLPVVADPDGNPDLERSNTFTVT